MIIQIQKSVTDKQSGLDETPAGKRTIKIWGELSSAKTLIPICHRRDF
jgi:hypothetical protein